jgi:hypothetical protein
MREVCCCRTKFLCGKVSPLNVECKVRTEIGDSKMDALRSCRVRVGVK